MGIDRVTRPGDPQQFANAPGGGVVQGPDIYATQHSRQVRLPRHATPHLSNDATAGDHGSAAELIPVNQRPYLPILALNGDKGAGIENQSHSAGQPGGASCRLLLRLIDHGTHTIVCIRVIYVGTLATRAARSGGPARAPKSPCDPDRA